MIENPYVRKKNFHKNLVPRIITNNRYVYFAFIHKPNEKINNKPKYFYDFIFISDANIIRHREKVAYQDCIRKMTMMDYFYIAQQLKSQNVKYNLKQKIYEYNNQ